MTECVYCGLEASNVIEVRYARTVRHRSSSSEGGEAPREVLARGYSLCDGCLALLDYRIDHHLPPRKHSIYNLLSTVYHLFALWGAVAFGSFAGTMDLLSTLGFLTTGLVLALGCLIVWFIRASVHSRYFGAWRGERPNGFEPRNSLAGFTALRDRLNPELVSYLPVQIEDSFRLCAKPGSPPVRGIGPAGESWGQNPDRNFVGRAINEWYRLVTISWRLWPLTGVVEPTAADWKAPPTPQVKEAEVAVATVLSFGSFTLLMYTAGFLPLAIPLTVAFVGWPVGFFAGQQARHAWEAWRSRRLVRPVI